MLLCLFFFFSSRRRHTRCALVTGVQTCALPISPTEDAVEALFQRLFYSEDAYDLSRVGRMKVNSRLGRGGDITGPMTLTDEDILETIKVLGALPNGRGQIEEYEDRKRGG